MLTNIIWSYYPNYVPFYFYPNSFCLELFCLISLIIHNRIIWSFCPLKLFLQLPLPVRLFTPYFSCFHNGDLYSLLIATYQPFLRLKLSMLQIFQKRDNLFNRNQCCFEYLFLLHFCHFWHHFHPLIFV